MLKSIVIVTNLDGTVSTKSTLNTHIRFTTKVKKTTTKSTRVACQYCGQDFASKGGLHNHHFAKPSRPGVQLCTRKPV